MRIAIIGGGAAGLVTAYLLHEAHEVTLFERNEHLGGNVRTLNGNVACDALGSEVCENGVLVFHRQRSPQMRRLLAHLGVEISPTFVTAGYFFADGFHLLLPSPQLLRAEGLLTTLRHCGRYFRTSGVTAGLRLLATYGRPKQLEHLEAKPLGAYLPPAETRFGQSLRATIILALSNPQATVDQMSATMGLQLMPSFVDPRWATIRGGTYSYLQRMLDRIGEGIRLVLRSRITGIWRSEHDVQIDHGPGATERYDQVVFATTPDQVLTMLRDPDPEEQSRFRPWQENRFTTVVHSDTSIYAPQRDRPYSPSDIFVKKNGELAYNAYMKPASAAPATFYSMAFNLEERIDPSKVIDRYEHRTPLYSAAAVPTRRAIREDNGSRRTWHAGAYFGDGNQEGAVTSALEISRQLGGRTF